MKFLVPIGGVVEGVYGILTAPNHKGIAAGIKAGLPWAADIGCLEGPPYVKRVDMFRALEWLMDDMLPYQSQCLFVAGGDVVANAGATLETFEEFGRYFITSGWPWAYIAQNGAEDLPIPDRAAAVFIGGDTSWKESMNAVSVIKRAQRRGLHIHIGRVNWKRRYELFNMLGGSDRFTCDGTRTRYDGAEKTLNAWRGYRAQLPLGII